MKNPLRILLPTCREVSRLQSDSLDRKLSSSKRFGLRLHLLACRWCRRYGRQIQFLRSAVHEQEHDLASAPSPSLSPEARERIKTRLRE